MNSTGALAYAGASVLLLKFFRKAPLATATFK